MSEFSMLVAKKRLNWSMHAPVLNKPVLKK